MRRINPAPKVRCAVVRDDEFHMAILGLEGGSRVEDKQKKPDQNNSAIKMDESVTVSASCVKYLLF